VWKIALPPIPQVAAVSDLFLKISYQGDVARLYRGQQFLDDSFWNGVPWTIGLREIVRDWRAANTDLELRILPLPESTRCTWRKPANSTFQQSGLPTQ